jgi:23S rRNA (guanosine2251-2'-O)-methyltransferase
MARPKRRLLGSHQKCWLWGRHVVMETLRARKWAPLELYLSDSLAEHEQTTARGFAQSIETPVHIKPPETLQKLCRSAEHQGYVAKMPEFPYDDAVELCDHPTERPLYILLDGVQDPYNFGAIVRSADVFGVDALFLKQTGQVGVTSLVARASAGAVNFVPIARTDLATLAGQLRDSGLSIIGMHPSAEVSLPEIDFRGPSAVIIGNEAVGMSDELRHHCDHEARIPQQGHVDSLNAAVAAGIVLYEAARQRSQDDPYV